MNKIICEQSRKRNEFLNFLKFILIMIVAFHHTGWWSGVMRHGYIAVEFFFMVSGYFLYQTFINKGPKLKEYLLSRIERIYPTYILILVIYMLFSIGFPQFFSTYNWKGWIITAFRDLFLLQSVGLNYFDDISPRFNPNDWYISSFFWSSMLLYYLLRFKRLTKVFLTVVILSTYSFYFLFKISSLNEYWGYYYLFYMPFWRAIAGMSIGILIGMFLKNEKNKKTLQCNIKYFNMCAIISIVVICFCIITPKDYDCLCCISFVCLIMNVLTHNGIGHVFVNNKYIKHLPDFSFEILLLHQILIPFSVKFMSIIGIVDINFLKYISYAAITIFISYLFNREITLKIRLLIQNIKNISF